LKIILYGYDLNFLDYKAKSKESKYKNNIFKEFLIEKMKKY